MSDLFRPISIGQLASWLFGELDRQGSAFGIPQQHFFVPDVDAPYWTSAFDQSIDTPFGPAAGPHTQMAQNIVAAWLCGARYIELKTVQTLDDIDVSKPCIDMQDEGYNVEWSQELRVYESFDEYLRAWVLIHALHHKLGFTGDKPNVVFNLSVGYDLEGIHKPNMQWFLDQVCDSSAHIGDIVDAVGNFYPPVHDIDIPRRISNNVTLSTMHGCPPDEIESICEYLLGERGLHTLVKCNPTLLGPNPVRQILSNDLGFTDVIVPDAAFEHDLKYADALPMLRHLSDKADESGLRFGVKLSNTLEVENVRTVFDPGETTAYLSGRALHAVTVNLACRLADDFDGGLPMSFSAGATCFNAPELLASGMQTITICSDLLKTGGYMRLLDYIDAIGDACRTTGADSISEFVTKMASSAAVDTRHAALANLRRYAEKTRDDPDNVKRTIDTSHTKTPRKLALFDCIQAPCVDECPLQQRVPEYLDAISAGDPASAQQVIRADNPIACILGRACDHRCELTCVRTHLDEPVAIRDIKRFAMEQGDVAVTGGDASDSARKVAIIGAGPGGIAAAAELAGAGAHVEIFEQHPYAGGMVGGAVPEYRVPRTVFERDFSRLESLGVKLHFDTRVGRDVQISDLRRSGFDNVVIMVGAQLGRKLSLDGEDCRDVIDALEFLRLAREDRAPQLGRRVGIIGAGDTAMDCARVAWRQGEGNVTLIYRRSIDQMPAEKEEIEQLLDEGIDILEMAMPEALLVEAGKLRALTCTRTQYRDDRDATGRKVAHRIPESEFDVPLDNLILAISQHALLDFFDGEPIAVNDQGYIAVDPGTFETSLPGVYAGGDVVNEGPQSIVKAAAAGRAIADSILERRTHGLASSGAAVADLFGLLRRRSHRVRRTHALQIPVAQRKNFDEVVLTYSESQASSEAARCLQCDTYCGICVSVCPNTALFSYETAPAQPKNACDGNGVVQRYQVALLADLCNECGNCTTFCPTSGRPFRDKPRLYLDYDDFQEENDNAFLVRRDGDTWTMDARWGSKTYRLTANDETDGGTIDESLRAEHRDAMYALLNGLRLSRPFLPVAPPAGIAATGRIAHPGYEE